MRRLVVAIDGPAGAGKSTVTKALARALGYQVLDTGALYRLVALLARDTGVAFSDEKGLSEIAKGIAAGVRFELVGEDNRIFWRDRDVSTDIRTPDISSGASQVSALPGVRAALLSLQQEIGKAGGVVAEGRDIGTVVFANADVKFFLTASVEKRAERRLAEVLASGKSATLEETMAQIQARDERDSGREVAPLRAADDAVVVDCSKLNVAEVVDGMLGAIAKRAKRLHSS